MSNADASKEPLAKDKDRPAPVVGAPLIFISHDTRDAQLAEAFAKLLSSVSVGMLKSFRSSDKKGTAGIEYGHEWYPALMSTLNASSGVVCLLTERSLGRPWILYEAGVAKGKLDTPVYGIALGITLSQANTGPFAQFQNCDDDEESLTGLVMQLLTKIPNSAPERDAVLAQVKVFLVQRSEILAKLGENAADNSVSAEASMAKLFEEVKLIVQELPSKVEGRLAHAIAPTARRRRRRGGALSEMMHYAMDGVRARRIESLLPLIGILHEEFPWAAEIARELYRLIQLRDRSGAERTLPVLHEFLQLSTRLGFADRALESEAFHLAHELPYIFETAIEHIPKRAGVRIRAKSLKEAAESESPDESHADE